MAMTYGSMRSLVMGFAGAALALAMVGCSCPTKVQVVGNQSDVITVVGTGKMSAKPDVAQIQIGVESRASTVAAATADNNAQMAKLTAALKQAGVADADLQTSNFSVHYNERHDQPPQVLNKTGAAPSAPRGEFQVSNTLQVKVRDVAKVGPVLDAAVAAGANNIWGVSFSLDKEEAIRSKLRELAVKDGRERADALAQLANVKLGRVVSMSEVIGGGGVRNVGYAKVAMAADSAAGTPIESGEIEFSSQVELTYAIDAE